MLLDIHSRNSSYLVVEGGIQEVRRPTPALVRSAYEVGDSGDDEDGSDDGDDTDEGLHNASPKGGWHPPDGKV